MLIRFLFIASVMFVLSGCKTREGELILKSESELAEMEKQAISAHKAFIHENFAAAELNFHRLAAERTVSQNLYQLELLSALILQQKDAEAHKLLHSIHQDLETLTDARQSEKARSIWHGEQNKVFKGDSYERSTFYALMALDFLREENYEDALRSVKNGLLADADSNSEKAVGDNVMLLYLGAFAARKLNDTAAADEYIRAIRKVLPERNLSMPENFEGPQAKNCFAPLIAPPGNVLLVVWCGTPPTVARAGEYNEKRYIVKGKLNFDSLMLSVDHGIPQLFPQALGDVNYQATTRGGRLMDNVLADKAQVKKITEISRNIFLVAGGGLLTSGGIVIQSDLATGIALMGAGGGCYVVGGACWIVGRMMNPEADARYWKNLPFQFFMMPLALKPGKHTITLTGTFCGDRTLIRNFTINIRPDRSLNVIHLPLFTHGAYEKKALENIIKMERKAAVKKADLFPLAKELK